MPLWRAAAGTSCSGGSLPVAGGVVITLKSAQPHPAPRSAERIAVVEPAS
jgi:hypothetical protein